MCDRLKSRQSCRLGAFSLGFFCLNDCVPSCRVFLSKFCWVVGTVIPDNRNMLNKQLVSPD